MKKNVRGDKISLNFKVTNNIYGRKKEINKVLQIYNYVKKGNKRITLISGYSGIGKSSLIKNIYNKISKENLFFINGKFEQNNINLPFSAFKQAFKQLIDYILLMPNNEIAEWRKKIINTLGKNAQVVTNVIPSLDKIIGKQPELQELGLLENQNRFNLYFQKFINIFTAKNKPLIIFLDDLQWADIASLKLIKTLITDTLIESFLIIGAYRDNEVNKSHPLNLLIGELKNKIPFDIIKLSALNIESVNSIISDTLKSKNKKIKPLSEIIHKKTNGNPFFIIEFLKMIYYEKKIKFENSEWIWDTKEISQKQVTYNVADLVLKNIIGLTNEEQRLIKLAACIGNNFSLERLSIIYENNINSTFSAFYKLVQNNLLFYIEGEYYFVHDKIQETVYSFIEYEEKQKIHYKIGKLLLNTIDKNEIDKNLFYITDQLNNSYKIMEDPVDINQLIKLNQESAKKAIESTAYKSAIKYYEMCIRLLGKNSWENNYNFTLSIYQSVIEASYLSTNFEKMNDFINIVQSKSKTVLDIIKIYEIKLQAYFAQNKFKNAIKFSRDILIQLGIKLPYKATKFHILFEFIKTQFSLFGKDLEYIINLPKINDEIKYAAIRIMMSTGTASYYSFPNLLPIMILKIIRLSIKHGNSSYSPFYYIAYAFLIYNINHNIDYGLKLCKFIMSKIKNENNDVYVKTSLLYNTFFNHASNHIKNTLKPLYKNYEIGLEIGNFEYSSLSILAYYENLFFSGKNLIKLDNLILLNIDNIKRLKQERVINNINIDRQMILKLIGENDNRHIQFNKEFNEESVLKHMISVNDRASICSLYYHKLFYNYLFYNYNESIIYLKKSKKYIDSIIGLFDICIFTFYYSLTLIVFLNKVNIFKKIKYIMIIKRNQKKMKRWAKYSPMNYLNKYYLVEAELNRELGIKNKCEIFYEISIKLAKENGFVHEEALANELYAKYYKSLNNELFLEYLKKAYNCYIKWGAMSKLKHLENLYPEIIK